MNQRIRTKYSKLEITQAVLDFPSDWPVSDIRRALEGMGVYVGETFIKKIKAGAK